MSVSCAQCHSSGVYAGLATTCVSCHLANYQKTTNPKHAAAGFPQDCSVCHSTTTWAGAVFDHSKTSFPLVGCIPRCPAPPAMRAACTRGSPPPASRATCRITRRRPIPYHSTAGFPQQCELCHTPAGWIPSTFNHSSTPFPLTGAHTSVACASCHIGGKYAGTPTDLLLVPQGHVRLDDESEPHCSRLPDHLPDLPHHHHLGRGDLQPHLVPGAA